MLRSGLSVSHYLSPAVFAAEEERLFRRLWIFAGFAQLLSRPNAYVTREIGGVPVVIQNMGGKLRAFENLCAHRQMALQWDLYGERPLICRYHGWAYDENGRVKGIPNAALYQFGEAERKKLCLREFSVVSVGKLVFVNLDDNPLPLEEQFHADYLEKLSLASSHLDDEVIHCQFEAAWNWKLNFENVLDPNHVQFIHPDSFFPVLNAAGEAEEAALSPKMLPIMEQMAKGHPVDLRDLSYTVASPVQMRRPWYSGLVERYGEFGFYHNWFIFPNVNFCSVQGVVFLLQQFMPSAPDRTDFHLSVAAARRKDPDSDFTALLIEQLRREKYVIDEDGRALSALQARLHGQASSARHGAYEAHIVRMLRWYLGALNGAEG